MCEPDYRAQMARALQALDLCAVERLGGSLQHGDRLGLLLGLVAEQCAGGCEGRLGVERQHAVRLANEPQYIRLLVVRHLGERVAQPFTQSELVGELGHGERLVLLHVEHTEELTKVCLPMLAVRTMQNVESCQLRAGCERRGRHAARTARVARVALAATALGRRRRLHGGLGDRLLQRKGLARAAGRDGGRGQHLLMPLVLLAQLAHGCVGRATLLALLVPFIHLECKHLGQDLCRVGDAICEQRARERERRGTHRRIPRIAHRGENVFELALQRASHRRRVVGGRLQLGDRHLLGGARGATRS